MAIHGMPSILLNFYQDQTTLIGREMPKIYQDYQMTIIIKEAIPLKDHISSKQPKIIKINLKLDLLLYSP
jgi:hypothetical protein